MQFPFSIGGFLQESSRICTSCSSPMYDPGANWQLGAVHQMRGIVFLHNSEAGVGAAVEHADGAVVVASPIKPDVLSGDGA
jgi:hypothetical protein